MADAPLTTSRSNGVLHVIHDHGGGTEHHVRALIDGSRDALAPLSRDRGRRSLAGRGASRRRRRAHVRLRRATRTRPGRDSSAASARRSASRSSTCTTSPGAATASSRRSPRSACRTATRCTTSTSRARRSRSSRADGMYCGAQTDAARVRRAASPRSRRSRAIDIVAWRARHRALLARRRVPHRAVALGRPTTLATLLPRARRSTVIPHGRRALGDATGDGRRRSAPARSATGALRCPTTTCRRSRCWARSVRTRARAGSSAWSTSCARTARACASC